MENNRASVTESFASHRPRATLKSPRPQSRGCPSGRPPARVGPVPGAVRALPVDVSGRQAAKQLAAAASHEHNIFPLAAASSYLLLFNNLAGRAARQDAGTAPCVRASLLPAPKSSSSSSSPSSPAGQLRPGTSPFPPAPGPAGFASPPTPGAAPGPAPHRGVFLLTASKTDLFGGIWGVFSFPRSAFFCCCCCCCRACSMQIQGE